jgi:hypothetical protein
MPLTMRPTAVEQKRKTLDLPLRPLAGWLKSKNPACEAARREAEEDWGR